MNSIENTLHSSTGHFKINILGGWGGGKGETKGVSGARCWGVKTPEVHRGSSLALTRFLQVEKRREKCGGPGGKKKKKKKKHVFWELECFLSFGLWAGAIHTHWIHPSKPLIAPYVRLKTTKKKKKVWSTGHLSDIALHTQRPELKERGKATAAFWQRHSLSPEEKGLMLDTFTVI